MFTYIEIGSLDLFDPQLHSVRCFIALVSELRKINSVNVYCRKTIYVHVLSFFYSSVFRFDPIFHKLTTSKIFNDLISVEDTCMYIVICIFTVLLF